MLLRYFRFVAQLVFYRLQRPLGVGVLRPEQNLPRYRELNYLWAIGIGDRSSVSGKSQGSCGINSASVWDSLGGNATFGESSMHGQLLLCTLFPSRIERSTHGPSLANFAYKMKYSYRKRCTPSTCWKSRKSRLNVCAVPVIATERGEKRGQE